MVKNDGFNLDAVEVTISKPLDETDWAAGYCVQLVYGQDASSVGIGLTQSENNYYYYYANRSINMASIKQAYVELRAPLGNGIDIKMGVWDTILGYEGFDAGNNPNYTRSYGYGMEPSTYAGILASYKFCDVVSVQAGVANNPANAQNNYYQNNNALSRSGTDSRKTYLGSVALTAPQSWGVLAGSTLYGAVAYGGYGQSSASYGGTYYTHDAVNYYVGAVVNTGVKGLKVGAAYDYLGTQINYAGSSIYNYTTWNNAAALYASFQATEKLSVHARAEYAWNSDNGDGAYGAV